MRLTPNASVLLIVTAARSVCCLTLPPCPGAVSQDSDFLIFDMGEACYLPLDSLQIKQASKPGKWTITCQTFRVDLTASMFNFDKKVPSSPRLSHRT